MAMEEISVVLRSAREEMGVSQKELARRVGVSARLLAEFERGLRPNVSFETALRMLAAVGVSIRLTDPLGASHQITQPGASQAARAARAAVRRATWRGRQLRLMEEGQTDPGAPRGVAQLAAVTEVSRQAYAVARARAPREQNAAQVSTERSKRASGRVRP
jgi:transcriptional regulator with XRE-family HTH domain